ncbi:MAG: DEAD/DEAH box helicase [Mycoplasma sp.]
MKITDLNINKKLAENLTSLGYTELTEIQAAVMNPMLENINILAQAQTGSGKTAAFLLPIIEKILNNKGQKALIVAPTRDLAMQIFDNAIKYAKGTGIRTGQFFGGSSYSRQIRYLETGIDIIIGTPGRLMDLHKRKNLDLGEVNYLVLDEADQMLDMGFIDDIRKIRRLVGDTDQISFFSATMPKQVIKLISEIMESYETFKIESKINVNDVITQSAYLTLRENKPKVLLDILGDSKRTGQQVIIFSRTKNEASDIHSFLRRYKFKVEALHSDRSQSSRTRAMKMFRSNDIQILVATNVAARGIDINNLPLVINYNLPEDIETYVHRIGRTGRIGNKGEAISLISKADAFVIDEIEKKIGAKIEVISEDKYLNEIDTSVEHNIRESQIKRTKPKGHGSGGGGRSYGGGRSGGGSYGGGRSGGSSYGGGRSGGGSYGGGRSSSGGSFNRDRKPREGFDGERRERREGDSFSKPYTPRSDSSYGGGRSGGGSYGGGRSGGSSYGGGRTSDGSSYSRDGNRSSGRDFNRGGRDGGSDFSRDSSSERRSSRSFGKSDNFSKSRDDRREGGRDSGRRSSDRRGSDRKSFDSGKSRY